MNTIQILGVGCARCEKLAEIAGQAADESGLPYTLEKVTDMDRIMDFGVLTTPALVINGEVKTAGKIPKKEDIKKMLV